MVESAAATDVVGNTTLQPAWVSRTARSVARTLSSSTIRIDRPPKGLSTTFTHDFEAHRTCKLVSVMSTNELFANPGTVANEERCPAHAWALGSTGRLTDNR